MVTQTEGRRLKEAYRLALNNRDVARHYEMFRDGKIVQFMIDDETGFSDGVVEADRIAIVGQYQLRYGPSKHPGMTDTYSAWGRLSSSTSDADWIPIEGPWRVGDGPFDRKRN